ncbi:MAG: pyridoxine 5'-phosphate synthase [Candidatus Marinimicrobia bacterium]|nr:pyridoxine 5'-phosphate synthase [Candidatus Neomarinimicrobiota bacterium]|tara:strand:+ start:1456 stop:2193 length:738 start_codon:yes stop_codon:yes gene_type:complete
MTALSVNINKFALVRNARGANLPDIINISEKCLQYGADGITVHPRPDERHAKFKDLSPLKKLISKYENKEFNIEGYPSENFIEKIINAKPDQVTLVPDPPGALTSSFGWDCKNNKTFLTDVVREFHNNQIRVSLFINPSINTLENLGIIATDRVELYTYDYAHNYSKNKSEAIKSYVEVSKFIESEFPKIEFNAGHDLNLENLEYFLKSITNIKEVSIGHALICDTFEFGLEKTIKNYLEISSKL